MGGVALRCLPFLPQRGFCPCLCPQQCPRKGRRCQSEPLAVGPGSCFEGSCRGSGAGQPLPARPPPRHWLGLNFQLLQNKFPGGCTRGWHSAELPACLSSAMSMHGGGLQGCRMGLSCPEYAMGWGSLPAARLQDRAR